MYRVKMELHAIDRFDVEKFKTLTEITRKLPKPSVLFFENSLVSCYTLDGIENKLLYGDAYITFKFDTVKGMRLYRRNRRIVLLYFTDEIEVVDEYVQDIYVRIVKYMNAKEVKYDLNNESDWQLCVDHAPNEVLHGNIKTERKIVAPRPTRHPTVVPDTTHVDKSILIFEAAPGGIKYFDKAAFPSYQPETEGPTDFAIGAASSKDHVRNQIARHGKMVPSSSPWATVSSHPKYPREVPKYPLYFRPEERLKTFCNWSSSSKPPPALMSSSGFFNSGMGGDTVRCFQCGVGLRDWTTGDDPLLEHMRNSEKCPFLLAELGPEVMRDMMSDAADDSLEYDKPRSSVTDASSARPTSLPFPVRTMEFETMEARLKSLKDLPTNVKQSHLSIAVAGFFFTGRDDLCRCFTCDGGLKNWNPQDDPMEEHAKHFPQCQYIKHVKGDEYIQEVQRKLRSGQIDRGATGGGQSTELPGKNDIDVLLEMGFPMDKIETTISKLRQQGIATPTLQKVLDTIV